MITFAQLPDEVVLRVIAGLGGSIDDLTALQHVSRRFYKLARDGGIWKSLCFEGSIAGRRHNRSTIPKTIPSRQVQVLQAEAAAVTSTTLQESLETVDQRRKYTRAQEVAKWDSRIPGETTDWYREYIAREAAINVDWAWQGKDNNQEIEGLARLRTSNGGQAAVARFGDGRVGVWAFDGGETGQSGTSFKHSARSILKSGYPGQYDGMLHDQASISESAITDCVSIDRNRQKAYIAVECQLNEVDLHTLQLSNCTAMPRPISALSNIPANSPLMVGTSAGLFRYDWRVLPRGFDGDHLLQHHQSLSNPASAPEPMLSLSILQSQAAGYGSGPAEIYAAGRFKTILMYDQRTFPKVTQSIWSGADLSSLSMLPQILPQIPQDGNLLNNTHSLGTRPVPGHTVFAAGAKNGKGSLEVYGIDRSAGIEYGSIKNRTMASRVKLLSVVPHGKRICTSDADGNIKWFERDGFNLVRQVNTNNLLPKQASSRSSSPGLFGVQQDTGDVVQKIIPLGKHENADLLIWAGNRAGVLKIGSKVKTPEVLLEDEATATARKYEENMRRLLEAQAMEARRMQDFGME